MKYRWKVSNPINRDQFDLYLVRYDLDNESQEYMTSDMSWHSFQLFEVIEPCMSISGIDIARMEPNPIQEVIEKLWAEKSALANTITACFSQLIEAS
jgi:hypothetical protein